MQEQDVFIAAVPAIICSDQPGPTSRQVQFCTHRLTLRLTHRHDTYQTLPLSLVKGLAWQTICIHLIVERHPLDYDIIMIAENTWIVPCSSAIDVRNITSTIIWEWRTWRLCLDQLMSVLIIGTN